MVRFFSKGRLIKLIPADKKALYFLILRIMFWFSIYYFWVIYISHIAVIQHPVQGRLTAVVINSLLLALAMHVYTAESYITAVVFLGWVLLYYYITVKKQKLRIFTAFIIPGIFTFLLYYHFYYLGGVGDYSTKTIEKQAGVEVFYTGKDFPKTDYFHNSDWLKLNRFWPRELHIDPKQNAIYASYAYTYDNPMAKRPGLLRIDLETKETKYYLCRFARAISFQSDTILISPYYEKKIYELYKNDFSVKRVIPAQIDLEPWELADMYCDETNGQIYLSNEINPILLKYNYHSGNLIGQLKPNDIKYGSGMWNIKVSNKTGLMYLISYQAAQDILEIDPGRMEITKTLELNSDGILSQLSTCLKLDDEKGLLYFQHGGRNKLYEIDIETLQVKRTLKGEVHARHMILDRKRNVMYISSFFYGKLIALDLVSGRRLWEIKVGGKPYGMDIYNDNLYINSRAGIVKLDLKTIWEKY
jgi:hypothetical protein